MLKLYNSLSRKVENFKPLRPPHVGMYTCGPTVYSFAHIGNFRTYVSADLVLRVLKYNKLNVQYIMNLTDVGHLTGDNLGDADTGEDRMEKAAQKEGKTAWEVAQFYTEVFLEDYEKLNLVEPEKFTKATEHIKEQIELVQKLEKKGFTYRTSDGIYFDTAKFPKYGELSNIDEVKGGERIEVNEEKKNPRDFALWKFSPEGEKRQMEWKSPWARLPSPSPANASEALRAGDGEATGGQGVGFPGWHIECSAMSMKYLGETFDIHTGGTDLRETHHPNEIAQAEAATGKPFVKYWVHGAFILVNGEKMSKSKGNLYRLYDIEKDGYDALAMRYLYLQTHYRQEMNFTFPALDSAQNAFKKIVIELSKWETAEDGPMEPEILKDYEKRFLDAINDDLNMPQALGVVWHLLKSDNPKQAKAQLMFQFDEVLGLNLQELSQQVRKVKNIVPDHIRELVRERDAFRKVKKFNAADRVRAQIEKLGYEIEDGIKGTKVFKK